LQAAKRSCNALPKLVSVEVDWEPASYNVQWQDEKEYSRWRVLRKHRHGLTVISRYLAPPGKAWKIVGNAPELGEEAYILEGAYYNAAGRVIAGPGATGDSLGYARSFPPNE
jgi:hypothetical protein